MRGEGTILEGTKKKQAKTAVGISAKFNKNILNQA